MISVTSGGAALLNGDQSDIIDVDAMTSAESSTSEMSEQETISLVRGLTKKRIIAENSSSKEEGSQNSFTDNQEIRKFLSNGNSSVSIFPKPASSDLSNGASSTSKPVTSVGNVIVFSSRDSVVSKADNIQGRKVILVTNNVLKNSAETSELGNVVCTSQQLKDVIKQLDGDKQLKTVVTESDLSNLDSLVKKVAKPINTGKHRKSLTYEIGEMKNFKTVPSYVQISRDSLASAKKSKARKTTSSSRTSDSQMNKLPENIECLDNALPDAIKLPEKVNSSKVGEAQGVFEARNEVNRCKKKLIQAALNPRLHAKIPLVGYVGRAYSCQECADTFVYEENLKKHKDRRSALFTYACPSCKETLEFYNRCMFLMHVRSHDEAVKACYLTISTIPANKLHFQVIDTDDEEDSSSNEVPPPVPTVTPAVRRKIFIRSVEKRPSEMATVRIVNPVKKPFKVVASSVLDTITKISTVTDSTNSSQANGDGNELSNNITIDGTPSAHTEKSVTEEEPAVNEVLIKEDNVQDLGSEYESKPESLPVNEKSVSSKVTTDEKKKTNGVSQLPVKPTMNSSKEEEITLTSSDEEDGTENDVENKDKLVPCRECYKEVPDLPSHYRGENRPKKEYPCEQCQFYHSSKCALSAHVRMHSKTPPYICPDCGYFFSTLESFLTHVKQVCYYDYKALRFKCPECSVLKASTTQFSEHLIMQHTREVFKCDACMTSSYSKKVVEGHIKKKHPDQQVRILEGYWCKLCPNVLVTKSTIRVHLDKHACSWQYLRYVYICKHCKKFATGRMTKFANHYENNCPAILSLPKETKQKKSRKHSVSPRERANVSILECLEKDPLSVEDWEADKLKEEFLPKTKVCVMCRGAKLQENSLFCNECVRFVDADDQNECNPGTNKSLITPYSGRSKRRYKCKLCKELMSRDWVTLRQHLELFHQADFDVGSRSRSSNDLNSTSVSRKRKSATTDLAKNCNVKVAKPSEKTEKIELKFKCAVCSVGYTSQPQFHEHIVTHRSESNTEYQCMECGLCFIVRSTLEKHLIVEHKIRERDLVTYFKHHGMEIEETEEEERKLVENQCDVCFVECGTKTNYDRHIRTHGMAFVARQSKAKS